MQAETLQELSYAAEAAGVRHGVLEEAMLGFSARAAEAARSGGDLAVAAHRLGVRLTDGIGRVRKPQELLEGLADGFHRLKSETEKARLAQILFDQDGLELLSLLEKGSGNLKAMGTEARQLGLVMSNESIAAGDKLMQLGRRIAYVFKTLGYGLIQGMMPLLQGVSDGFERVGKAITVLAQESSIAKICSVLLAGLLSWIALELSRICCQTF